MEKMIYVVEELEIKNGSIFQGNELDYTFDFEKAEKVARYFLDRLTDKEITEREIWVNGYNITVDDEMTAKDAWDAFTDEMTWLPDPNFSKQIH